MASAKKHGLEVFEYTYDVQLSAAYGRLQATTVVAKRMLTYQLQNGLSSTGCDHNNSIQGRLGTYYLFSVTSAVVNISY